VRRNDEEQQGAIKKGHTRKKWACHAVGRWTYSYCVSKIKAVYPSLHPCARNDDASDRRQKKVKKTIHGALG
jgi:hypothetical protein